MVLAIRKAVISAMHKSDSIRAACSAVRIALGESVLRLDFDMKMAAIKATADKSNAHSLARNRSASMPNVALLRLFQKPQLFQQDPRLVFEPKRFLPVYPKHNPRFML